MFDVIGSRHHLDNQPAAATLCLLCGEGMAGAAQCVDNFAGAMPTDCPATLFVCCNGGFMKRIGNELYYVHDSQFKNNEI